MSLSNTASAGRWPARLLVGSFRVVRPSANYEQTIQFYRDLVGLPVLETFQGSYGEDGTIFGLPDSSTHLEIVRAREPAGPAGQFDQLVFYLTDAAAQREVMARLAADGQGLPRARGPRPTRSRGPCAARPGRCPGRLPLSGWRSGAGRPG